LNRHPSSVPLGARSHRPGCSGQADEHRDASSVDQRRTSLSWRSLALSVRRIACGWSANTVIRHHRWQGIDRWL